MTAKRQFPRPSGIVTAADRRWLKCFASSIAELQSRKRLITEVWVHRVIVLRGENLTESGGSVVLSTLTLGSLSGGGK